MPLDIIAVIPGTVYPFRCSTPQGAAPGNSGLFGRPTGSAEANKYNARPIPWRLRKEQPFIMPIIRFLQHPATIVTGVSAGLAFGYFDREAAQHLVPFGDLYVALLSMCMLPILVSALTWGIGQMLRNEATRQLFPRLAGGYVMLITIPCLAALLICLTLTPGADLSEGATAMLGEQLIGEPDIEAKNPFLELMNRLVPANIFAALSGQEFISIVFFSLLLGLALGMIDSPGADETLRVLNSFYQAFAKIFAWIVIPLPLGLFCLGASHMAAANPELVTALLRYVGYFYLAGIAAVLGLLAVLSVVARKPPWRVLADLKQPLIIGFATDNPLVALYSSIESLRQNFGIDRRVTDTVAPFGVIANQHGQVLLFTFTVFFLAQVFGVSLTAPLVIVVAISCLLTGAAAFGGGPALAPLLAPILLSADIPSALTVVVLATTQPAVAPLGSLLTVLGTATLTVYTAKPLANGVVTVEAAGNDAVSAAELGERT